MKRLPYPTAAGQGFLKDVFNGEPETISGSYLLSDRFFGVNALREFKSALYRP